MHSFQNVRTGKDEDWKEDQAAGADRGVRDGCGHLAQPFLLPLPGGGSGSLALGRELIRGVREHVPGRDWIGDPHEDLFLPGGYQEQPGHKQHGRQPVRGAPRVQKEPQAIMLKVNRTGPKCLKRKVREAVQLTNMDPDPDKIINTQMELVAPAIQRNTHTNQPSGRWKKPIRKKIN